MADHPSLAEDDTGFNAAPDGPRAALCCDLLLKIADLFGRYGDSCGCSPRSCRLVYVN